MRFLILVSCALMYASLLSIVACSWFTTSHVVDVSTIASCILAHSEQPPATIAIVCAIEDQRQITDILAAHRAAMTRQGLCPPPSNPGY